MSCITSQASHFTSLGPARGSSPRAGPPAVPGRTYAGSMPLYRDEGVVLRTRNLGEADRIITLLTRGRGRVRAVAKGVRRT